MHYRELISFAFIFRKFGIKGLYKGLELKLTQTVLMAALMFLTYEKIAAVVFQIMRAEKLRAAAS
jgi:adenine nucleotide transporter 17